jgi:MarR family transcriptional regulator, 2-MHQ and catechol-resistance regulon repressor
LVLGDRREAFYGSLLAKEYGARYDVEAASLRIALDLTFTCDIFHQLTACHLSGFGLSRSTFNILMLLHHGPPDGMQLHELGELLLVSRANITGLIDHLEQKKLVTRVIDRTDRRARFATITAAGSKLIEEISPKHEQTVESLLQDVSVEEKRILLGLLRKVRESLASSKTRMSKDTICMESSKQNNGSR